MIFWEQILARTDLKDATVLWKEGDMVYRGKLIHIIKGERNIHFELSSCHCRPAATPTSTWQESSVTRMSVLEQTTLREIGKGKFYFNPSKGSIVTVYPKGTAVPSDSPNA